MSKVGRAKRKFSTRVAWRGAAWRAPEERRKLGRKGKAHVVGDVPLHFGNAGGLVRVAKLKVHNVVEG